MRSTASQPCDQGRALLRPALIHTSFKRSGRSPGQLKGKFRQLVTRFEAVDGTTVIDLERTKNVVVVGGGWAG